MASRQKFYWLVGLLVVAALAWMLVWPEKLGLCGPRTDADSFVCVNSYLVLSQPAAFILTALSLSLFFSLVSKSILRKTWIALTATYLLVSALVYATVSQVGEPLRLLPGRLAIILMASVLYVITSLVIAIYKSWKNRVTR